MVRTAEWVRQAVMGRCQRVAKLICQHLPDGRCKAVEVGCYRGAVSEEVLRQHKQVQYTMVDPWMKPERDSEYLRTGGYTAIHMLHDAEGRYQEAMDCTDFAKDRRTVMRMTSLEAASKFNDCDFDLVYLDGLHTYQDVLNDLIAWYPKIASGGVLGGHDYFHASHKFMEVQPAVDKFAKEHGLEVERGRINTWFIRLPENKDAETGQGLGIVSPDSQWYPPPDNQEGRVLQQAPPPA